MPAPTQIVTGDPETPVNATNPLYVSQAGGATPVKATTLTTAQVTVPATANGIAILAANSARLGATITNIGNQTVFFRQAATGVTVSNGTALPPGASFNIDAPLYTGAIGGIVVSGTCVVTTAELTA